MVVHPQAPRVAAVLDWELATIGHPLCDLAYACMPYRIAPRGYTTGLLGADLAALGIPVEEELLARYCRRVGRADVPEWSFFLAFSFFRSAAIAQGVYARALQGNAADRRGIELGEVAQHAAATGWQIASGN
jgi:aminoglycoside phosphotransferase (APT) family kinase protein